MKPSVEVGAGQGKETVEEAGTSNNLVPVEAIVQKKSTPAIISSVSASAGCTSCRIPPYVGYANTGSYG